MSTLIELKKKLNEIKAINVGSGSIFPNEMDELVISWDMKNPLFYDNSKRFENGFTSDLLSSCAGLGADLINEFGVAASK